MPGEFDGAVGEGEDMPGEFDGAVGEGEGVPKSADFPCCFAPDPPREL